MFCRKTSVYLDQLHQVWSSTNQGVYVAVLVSIIIAQACQSKVEEDRSLSGKWQIISAFRDGQSTSTLEDAFFHFVSDSTFVTNIFEDEETYEYVRTEGGFNQLGSNNLEYLLDDTNPDTLIIQTSVRNYHFSFIAARDTSIHENIEQEVKREL